MKSKFFIKKNFIIKQVVLSLLIVVLMGVGNTVFALCQEPKGINRQLSSDLVANQEYIAKLKAFERCLSNSYKEKYDAAFIKKYNQQRAKQAVLLDRIEKIKKRKGSILYPLKNHKKYGGFFTTTGVQMKAYNQYEKNFEDEKAKAAKRLGLDVIND